MNEFMRLYGMVISEKAESADAIVWLQGDRFNRSQKTFELYKAGYADRIIITGNNMLVGDGARPGENNITLDEMNDWLISKGVPESAILIDNGAMNTKEQAENIIALAKKNGWEKIIIVGSSYYQPRAFLTFLKAGNKRGFKGKIINQPAMIRDEAVPEGRDKTAKELISEEIGKLEKYADDTESIDAAINHLSKHL